MNLQLEAMALTMPDVAGHPNRLPFRGVLTLVGVASQRSPSGARGHRVMLTRPATEAALPSLLGMALDYAPSLDCPRRAPQDRHHHRSQHCASARQAASECNRPDRRRRLSVRARLSRRGRARSGPNTANSSRHVLRDRQCQRAQPGGVHLDGHRLYLHRGRGVASRQGRLSANLDSSSRNLPAPSKAIHRERSSSEGFPTVPCHHGFANC